MEEPMKLILAIVNNEDVSRLTERLTEAGIRATRVASTGGFLRQGNTTFMMGVPAARVDEVLSIIRETCRRRTRYVNPLPPAAMGEEFITTHPLEVEVGGAIVFVLPIERFERY